MKDVQHLGASFNPSAFVDYDEAQFCKEVGQANYGWLPLAEQEQAAKDAFAKMQAANGVKVEDPPEEKKDKQKPEKPSVK